MKKTKNLVLTALFVALIAAGAFLKIPLPGVPISLQTLFTMLAGMLLGAKLGALSVGVYIALGLMGLPIFTSGGGITYVFQPTFGYMIGFVLAAALTGWISRKVERPGFVRLLLAGLAGTVVIYLCGTVYFYLISVFYLGKAVAIWPLVVSCMVTPLPGDILKCVLGALLARRLIPILDKDRV